MRLEQGNCLEVMRRLAEEGVKVDAIVTDPPYHLTSGGNGGGFMGKAWDGGDVAFNSVTWGTASGLLKPGGYLLAFGGTRTYHRLGWAIEGGGFEIRDCIAWLYGSGFPKSHNLDGEWDGWGTALKPALEPICVARKPLGEKTVAANVLKHGTGAINVDGCRIEAQGRPAREGDYKATENTVYEGRMDGSLAGGSKAVGTTDLGRWPANVCHDGSPEVEAAFAAFGEKTSGGVNHQPQPGTASRFFYTAKADAHDRWGSKHPTVKPIDLMRWLVRLVTPPGGTVLDPFAGSGTTGIAAMAEGFDAILIEREDEYIADIRERLAFYQGEGRHSLASKNRKREHGHDDLPLFGAL